MQVLNLFLSEVPKGTKEKTVKFDQKAEKKFFKMRKRNENEKERRKLFHSVFCMDFAAFNSVHFIIQVFTSYQ